MTGIVDWRSSTGCRKWRRAELPSHFIQLFFDFLRWACDVGPVESDACCTILQPMRTMKSWKRSRQSIANAPALLRFHALPWLPRGVAIEMWMPRFHFGYESGGYITERERSAFLGNDGMKEYLKQHVAELFAQKLVVVESN